MGLYYVETQFGCGVREATNIQQAQADIRKEVGSYGRPTVCRKATRDDLAWVEGMGGYIPEGGKYGRKN